jgi:hypothetical protein
MPSYQDAREDHDDTLGQKALVLGVFGVTATLGLTALHASGRALPSTSLRDLVVLGLATNRLSRLVARDAITRPIRAPFTELLPESDPSGKLVEKPAGSGMRRVLGELVTCPRCTAMWSALGLTLGYAMAPRATRTISMLLSLAAVSDVVNHHIARTR